MLPGIMFASVYFHIDFSISWCLKLIVAIAALCLIASSNYIINEYLDAEFDKFHPVKKKRTTVQKKVELKFVILEYILFAAVGGYMG